MEFLNSKYAIQAIKRTNYTRLYCLECNRDCINMLIYDFVEGKLIYNKLVTDEVIQNIYKKEYKSNKNYFIVYAPKFILKNNGKITTSTRYIKSFGIKAYSKTLLNQGYIDCLNNLITKALTLSGFNYSVISESDNTSQFKADLPNYYNGLIQISYPIANASKGFVITAKNVLTSNLYV